MTKNIFTIAFFLTAAALLTIPACAQTKQRSMNANLFSLVESAKQGRSRLNLATARQIREDFDESDKLPIGGSTSIVGTWNCVIPQSNGGSAPFEALQTFSSDGTFVETSSLLGIGGEGPAHGVYGRVKQGYVLTFELFVFDPESGASVGRVRVRASIKMTSASEFEALTAVDFIDVDGSVIPDIDGGPFHGTRLQARGV